VATVEVDNHLRTSVPHIFAAGDITGRLMLVPQAVQDGFLAATNAVQDHGFTLTPPVSPVGSFTAPEYAKSGSPRPKPATTTTSSWPPPLTPPRRDPSSTDAPRFLQTHR
jgi:pyruvate/2-oxoglutarate dehydrogenase complex dihydrolipoamide dehydrogenase (E3) component